MIKYEGVNVLTDLEEIVDPRHTLLVIYDAMNMLMGRTEQKLSHGGFTNAVPDMIPRWKRILNAARKVSIPVVFTHHASNYAWLAGPWILYYMKYQGVSDPAKLYVQSTLSFDTDIIEELKPQPGEIVLRKHYNSVFSGTNFLQLLHARNIKTIVLTGIATESGIETSARQALIEGYYAVIPTDCVNSSHPDLHEGALKYLARGSTLTTTDDIINIWSR